MLKISFWDLKVGDFIKMPGAAKNAYEITSKSEKQICMRRVKDGMEHCMETSRVLDIINQNLGMNGHLVEDRSQETRPEGEASRRK